MVERYYPFVLALIAPILVCYFDILPKDIVNYKDILNSTISIGSIAVGFLAAAVTLLPSLGSNRLVQVLKQMGAYRKLLQYLITAIIGLFITALLSVVGLFIDPQKYETINHFFLIVWSYMFFFAVLASIRVIQNFLKFLLLTQDDDSI